MQEEQLILPVFLTMNFVHVVMLLAWTGGGRKSLKTMTTLLTHQSNNKTRTPLNIIKDNRFF